VPDQKPRKERRAQSAGSGVIIDADKGYVITNYHVIKGADEIEVTLKDGRTLKAKLLGKDSQVDLALLKIKPDHLTALKFADARKLQVGDFVVAIGNPFALGQTVTSGIVSALGRSGLGIEGYEDFIQTDASINPGNSGGALINLRGELVGINSAIIAPAGGNVGIGFAIPSDIVRLDIEQLLRFGEVRRGRLGIQFQNLTPDLAEAFSLSRHQGAVISKVYDNSAAERAGLKAGDIVTGVDDRPITSAKDLRNRIGLTPVDDPIKLAVLRDGKSLTIKAKIEATPEDSTLGEDINLHLSGTVLGNYLEKDSNQSLAVEITSIKRGSNAFLSGLRQGDLIVSANRQRVKNIKQLQAIVNKNGALLLRIQRDNDLFFLVFR
jgi:serine protease Do/serine protease DegQ